MATNLEQISDMVRQQLEPGLMPDELNPSLNLWIEDAAEAINARRKTTTRKEVSITIVPGTQSYALPTDCESVDELIVEGLRGDDLFPGIPLDAIPGFIPNRPWGALPTGQVISPSIDLIDRQSQRRMKRELTYHLLGTALVLDFQVDSERRATVVYTAADRSVETLPRRHWSAVVKKCRAEAVGVFLDKAAMSAQAVADTLVRFNLDALRRQRATLLREWESHVAGVLPESSS